MHLISLYFCPSHFLIGLSFKILMEKWLRQVKIGQNGSNLPKSKPSFLKKRGKNSFSGFKGPSVLWLARFKWTLPIFEKVSPARIILAEWWNVPWYFYEVSSQGQVCRQMQNVDRPELLHTEVAVSICVSPRAWMGLLFQWKPAGVVREWSRSRSSHNCPAL